MKKYIYLLLILLTFSCTKDKVDYRAKYIGAWDFKVYQQIKEGPVPIVYKNFIYSGQIKFGVKANEILVKYSETDSISLAIDSNGVFAHIPSNTYSSYAHFNSENDIKISINNGGLGGWYFQDIRGTRK